MVIKKVKKFPYTGKSKPDGKKTDVVGSMESRYKEARMKKKKSHYGQI